MSKSCPGPDRKRQFEDILVPWMKEQRQGGKPKLSAPPANNALAEAFARARKS